MITVRPRPVDTRIHGRYSSSPPPSSGGDSGGGVHGGGACGGGGKEGGAVGDGGGSAGGEGGGDGGEGGKKTTGTATTTAEASRPRLVASPVESAVPSLSPSTLVMRASLSAALPCCSMRSSAEIAPSVALSSTAPPCTPCTPCIPCTTTPGRSAAKKTPFTEAAVAAEAEKVRATERVRGAAVSSESWRSRRRVVVVPARDTTHATSTPLHAVASAAARIASCSASSLAEAVGIESWMSTVCDTSTSVLVMATSLVASASHCVSVGATGETEVRLSSSASIVTSTESTNENGGAGDGGGVGGGGEKPPGGAGGSGGGVAGGGDVGDSGGDCGGGGDDGDGGGKAGDGGSRGE
eukprot:scaffold25144_cov54-Phaeocystis_antarctica.AAC.2